MRLQLESILHASTFLYADTVTFSSKVVAKSMVGRQFHSEGQLSTTPVNGDVPIDSPVFKHLSDPCVVITASVDDEPPTKKHMLRKSS